jgi:Cdc6-like AAA superfamily ATPase
LSDRRPLNQEQSGIFNIIVTAIQDQQKDADGTFLTLEGSGGTGKTELAKHIMAFMRSQTKADDGQPYLIHTVCSTALGAQNYPQGECTTAHSFFVLPVEQEYDKEIDDDCMQCLAATKPQRHELIQAIDVIFWDEAMSNHRECLEAVMREFDNLKGMLASSVRKQP